MTLAEASLDDLIYAMNDRLDDAREALWKHAPESDAPLFEHIEVEFNLQDHIITAETAARDHQGNPIYSYEFSENSVETIEPAVPSAAPVSELISDALANLPSTQEITETIEEVKDVVEAVVEEASEVVEDVAAPISLGAIVKT